MSESNTVELFGASYKRTGQGCKVCPFVDGTSCLLATFRADLVMAVTPCGFAWTGGAAHDFQRLEAEANALPDAALQALQARAEPAGWSVTQGADGLVVSRWGMSRTLPDLPAVEAFLNRAGVPQ